MLSEENPGDDAAEGSSSSPNKEVASLNDLPLAVDDKGVQVTLAIDSASVKAGEMLTG